MALGLTPPRLGILARNLLLCCQYLNDAVMHLFVLSGPDYSAATFQMSNPEIWRKASAYVPRHSELHGYRTISAIMTDLNKPDGRLYRKALEFIRIARQAYAALGAKFPHSEAIVPGGVNLDLDAAMLARYSDILIPYYEFAAETIGIWDDVFDFLYYANPAYRRLGEQPANLLDFGQWDSEDHYDARFRNCDRWGHHRWSTPGAVIDGKLLTNELSTLNCKLEEFSDFSFMRVRQESTIRQDPAGNELTRFHPWNKSGNPAERFRNTQQDSCYSWGSSTTWHRQVFEVGAYAKVYLSAISGRLPESRYLNSDGDSLQILIPASGHHEFHCAWKIPEKWNAFERNRARAYSMAFSLMVARSNLEKAVELLKKGERRFRVPITSRPAGDHLGVGFWGAGRGFLAHWAKISDEVIENYQVIIPSRINAGTRTPWGAPGPCESAVLNTPILETGYRDIQDFTGIDFRRAIQSFDPCMPCNLSFLLNESTSVQVRKVDTAFPL